MHDLQCRAVEDGIFEAAGTQLAPEGAIAGLERQASEEALVLSPAASAPPASAKGKGRAVEVNEDELDIELDEKVDYEVDYDEDDYGDEFIPESEDEEFDCGDDEYIPGPDDGDDEDAAFEHPITSGLPQEEDSEDWDEDDRFAQVLRSTINRLEKMGTSPIYGRIVRFAQRGETNDRHLLTSLPRWRDARRGETNLRFRPLKSLPRKSMKL
jgi:hypothetical protein